MPTLELTQSEANLLQDLFSTIASLDLNETVEDSDNQTFDSLWDKVVKLWSHFYWRFTMLLLDKLYAFIMNYFLQSEKFDPTKVTCSIDNRPVDCETWEETKWRN